MATKKDIVEVSSRKNELIEFFTDVAEMGLDEAIECISTESEILKDLPLVKWLRLGKEVCTKIQSAHFIKKYACFIGPISKVTGDTKLIADISDLKKQQEIVDQTMVYLDRYHTEFKATLLGQLFVQTFIHKQFSSQEYNSLMFSIDQIHPFEGLDTLRDFYRYRMDMDAETDDEKKRDIWRDGAKLEYQSLATTGLLKLPTGANVVGGLGGAYLNDLGKKFYELVVLDAQQKLPARQSI